MRIMAALDPIAEATAGRGTYKANCSSATAAVCLAGQVRSFEQASFSLAALATRIDASTPLPKQGAAASRKRYIYKTAGRRAHRRQTAAASVAASSGRCPAAGDL